MSKPDWVRVTDEATGHHITITRAQLVAEPSAFRELKQSAVDRNGAPLAPKYKQPLTGPKANLSESKANEEAAK